MVSRHPEDAVAQFVELLRTTTGCVTQVPLTAQPTGTGDYHIIFHGGEPIELRTRRGFPSIMLSIVHHCRPTLSPDMPGHFTVRSTYYAYEILDLDEKEILVYHWHPEGISSVTIPHLHLSPKIQPIQVASAGRTLQSVSLAAMHIPTSRILLEDVVRALIDDFKVQPLHSRYDQILSENAAVVRST